MLAQHQNEKNALEDNLLREEDENGIIKEDSTDAMFLNNVEDNKK